MLSQHFAAHFAYQVKKKKKNLKKKKRKITLTAHDWFGPVFHCHVETRKTKCEDISQPIINTPQAEISTYLNAYDNIQFFIYLFFLLLLLLLQMYAICLALDGS